MDQYADIFASHLRQHAQDYFPALTESKVEVKLRSCVEKVHANLYLYELTDGEDVHPLVVKMRHSQEDQSEKMQKRPKRYFADDSEKYWLESNALRVIENHFAPLNDERFGYIRMLDTLPEHQAFVMTESHAPDLRRIFMKQNIVQKLFKPRDLSPIFSNAGAWLNHYHALEKKDYVEARYNTKEGYTTSVATFIQFLSERLGDTAYFSDVMTQIEDFADRFLPDELPMGRAHGDYAMRNILVEPDNQIIIIDTLAKWHTPIYEDIGYFLVRLWINQLQVYSQGLAFDRRFIEGCANAFLEGYFGNEPVPSAEIKLHEILALLDKWCALIVLLGTPAFPQSDWFRARLTHSHFRRLLNRYLHSLQLSL